MLTSLNAFGCARVGGRSGSNVHFVENIFLGDFNCAFTPALCTAQLLSCEFSFRQVCTFAQCGTDLHGRQWETAVLRYVWHAESGCVWLYAWQCTALNGTLCLALLVSPVWLLILDPPSTALALSCVFRAHAQIVHTCCVVLLQHYVKRLVVNAKSHRGTAGGGLGTRCWLWR